ncbi:MAG: fructose 1,6-bisphosphatase [Methanocorpusculum sp.]|nr:fructose 1,6-bisphosphatase [Methanocorpusculum sp.]
MVAVSVYSKPLGGIAGRARVFPDVLQTIDRRLRAAKGAELSDFVVTHIGDRVVCLTVCADENAAAAEALRTEAFADGETVAAARKLFKNPAPAAECRLMFPERESEEFVLLMTGSEDALFWSDIVSVSAGQAAGAPSVMFCRTEGIFYPTAELLEMFAGRSVNARGVCPVSLCEGGVVRTNVMPVVALGFSLGNGRLTGPVDLFDSPLFDAARMRASET